MNPMTVVRVLWRAPAALAWTLGMHWCWCLRRLLFPRSWGVSYGTDIIGLWGRGLAWIMGMRIVQRNERPPTMGDVIISNHMGFLDVPLLLAHFPAVFIIKGEARKAPYFGGALAKHGHVFVERSSVTGRRSARDGVERVLYRDERLIVFPEGRASPGAERLPFKPFTFFEAQRQGKTIEAVVIDYLPDRRQLEWDVKRPMVPQLIELIGRKRTTVSIEFMGHFEPKDPAADAEQWKQRMQERLEANDREREAASATVGG